MQPVGRSISHTEPLCHGIVEELPSQILDSTKHIANEHFQNLLKFVSPAAKLTDSPSLIEFDFKGFKLKILNFTKIRLFFSFIEKKLYLISHNLKLTRTVKVATFTEEDCVLVAYHVKGSKIICIDNKKDYMPVPKTRIFISKEGDKYDLTASDEDLENLLGVSPQKPLGGKKFLKTDPTMINLLKELDSYAIFEKGTLGVYYSRANMYSHKREDWNTYRFTVLNLTDQKITFDIRRNFRINGDIFAGYTPDHCQIIAYRLKDFPKYFHILVQDEGESNFQKFTYYESWMNKHYQNHAIFDSKIATMQQKNNYQPNIKFQQPQRHSSFNSGALNDILTNNPHFSQLLQEISADAIAISEPTVIESCGGKKAIKILNLTSHRLSFDENDELQLKGFPIEKDISVNKKFLESSNLIIVAYKVLKNPDIICLDFKLLDDNLPRERHFIIKHSNFYFITASGSFHSKSFDRSLFSIQPKQDVAAALKIIKHPFVLSLESYMQKNKNGQLAIYPSWCEMNPTQKKINISIINYSNHCITIDTLNRLWIDNSQKEFKEPIEKDTIIIAYHPQNNSNKLRLKSTYWELNFEKKICCLNDSLKYHRFFYTLHFERVYNNLWRPGYNVHSAFSHLPREIIRQIAGLYLKCLKKSLDW